MLVVHDEIIIVIITDTLLSNVTSGLQKKK